MMNSPDYALLQAEVFPIGKQVISHMSQRGSETSPRRHYPKSDVELNTQQNHLSKNTFATSGAGGDDDRNDDFRINKLYETTPCASYFSKKQKLIVPGNEINSSITWVID